MHKMQWGVGKGLSISTVQIVILLCRKWGVELLGTFPSSYKLCMRALSGGRSLHISVSLVVSLSLCCWDGAGGGRYTATLRT